MASNATECVGYSVKEQPESSGFKSNNRVRVIASTQSATSSAEEKNPTEAIRQSLDSLDDWVSSLEQETHGRKRKDGVIRMIVPLDQLQNEYPERIDDLLLIAHRAAKLFNR